MIKVTGRYDGLHMYGTFGYRAYTHSLAHILSTVVPSQTKQPAEDHTRCPQAVYQNKHRMTTSPSYQSGENIFKVPVSNSFDVLGN